MSKYDELWKLKIFGGAISKVYDLVIEDIYGGAVVGIHEVPEEKIEGVKAVYERIVTCVNACSGIPSATLEVGVINAFKDEYVHLLRFQKMQIPEDKVTFRGFPLSEKERTCRVCGCTDNHACDGGCYWVEENLCSKCASLNGDLPF